MFPSEISIARHKAAVDAEEEIETLQKLTGWIRQLPLITARRRQLVWELTQVRGVSGRHLARQIGSSPNFIYNLCQDARKHREEDLALIQLAQKGHR